MQLYREVTDMWVSEYNGYLCIRCKDCGAELDAEYEESPGLVEPTIHVQQCVCKIESLEKEIAQLEAQLEHELWEKIS
jgi:hypothetical protein